MRKSKKNDQNKNLHLGFYFGILVFFIILVSIAFKIIDIVKSSKFDGNNNFTVAVISGKNTHIISASPKENSLKKLTITDINSANELNDFGIPYESVAKSDNDISVSAKSYFSKILFQRDGLNSDLTVLDLIRLSIYSQKTDNSKIYEEEISSNKIDEINKLTAKWFQDPQILEENLKIEITNTTNVSGLGNRLGKEISNIGSNVVLITSSPNSVKESKIYYKEDSYTVRKLSKLLNIPTEKKEISAISDILIEIGEDKENY